MGQKSREKWLRRIENAVLKAPRQPSRLQSHLPWLAPTVFAAVAGIAAGWGLDMIPFFILIALLFVAFLLVLWWLSDREKHKKIRIAGTMVLVAIAGMTAYWNYTYNRPRFEISIEQGYTGGADNSPLLGLRLYVTNVGRQASYAKRWDLQLKTPQKVYQGRQDFDLAVPKELAAAAELSIADSDFESGKPVRGWLFFYLPEMSHTDLMVVMGCGAKSEASIVVTLKDRKTDRTWEAERSSLDLVHSGCGLLLPPKVPSPEK